MMKTVSSFMAIDPPSKSIIN